MWSRLLGIFQLTRAYGNRAGAQAARKALEATYPGLESTAVWLQAREPGRDVVAVIYRERGNLRIPTGTPRHKIFAVRPDLTTEELLGERASPYAIRGVK